MDDTKITGSWGGSPIWRKKTAQEKAEENGIKPEIIELFIRLNENQDDK